VAGNHGALAVEGKVVDGPKGRALFSFIPRVFEFFPSYQHQPYCVDGRDGIYLGLHAQFNL